MASFNLHNKTFATSTNSSAGQANANTIFSYKQEGELVTADYSGGGIRYGKIIAHLQDDKLDMLYQCMTEDMELRAGKALAKISYDSNEKLVLSLNWEWINGGLEKGQSSYTEI